MTIKTYAVDADVTDDHDDPTDITLSLFRDPEDEVQPVGISFLAGYTRVSYDMTPAVAREIGEKLIEYAAEAEGWQ